MTTKTKPEFYFSDYDLVVAEERSIEIAKNFKLLGVDPEKISKATGLTKEEIENL